MASLIVRARSLPYRPTLRAVDRICTRCGIQFRLAHTTRDAHRTKCNDCKGMD